MGTTFIFTVVILSVLGLLLAVVLFLVAKKFKVEEDPLIDIVEATMPGANCGGCGFAGCRAFAEACVKTRSLEGKFCPVGGNAVMQKVAAHLGVTVEEKAPMTAVVRCNGTCTNRVRTNEYDGSGIPVAVTAVLAAGTARRPASSELSRSTPKLLSPRWMKKSVLPAERVSGHARRVSSNCVTRVPRTVVYMFPA